MASREEIQARLEFRKAALAELYEAYIALVKGQVQSYSVGSRNLTRFDLPKLKAEIKELEKEIDGLGVVLNGGKPRKAVQAIPRD
jgi:hypothetical protein